MPSRTHLEPAVFVPPSPLTLIERWAVGAQQTARRNAMIASTALTQRRAELDEVEEFLASLDGSAAREEPATAVHG